MKGSAPKVHSHPSDMTSLNSRLQLALINRKKGRNLLEKGFTLVELMIVIVIVGILSAVALPNFLNQTEKAKATEAKTKISSYLKQGHAEWQEAGKVGDTETEADADEDGKFYYWGALVEAGGSGDSATPPVWFVGASAKTTTNNSGAYADDDSVDASLAGKRVFGCVNLEDGVTEMSSALQADTATSDAKALCGITSTSAPAPHT